jgi:hypothetical protein
VKLNDTENTTDYEDILNDFVLPKVEEVMNTCSYQDDNASSQCAVMNSCSYLNDNALSQ